MVEPPVRNYCYQESGAKLSAHADNELPLLSEHPASNQPLATLHTSSRSKPYLFGCITRKWPGASFRSPAPLSQKAGTAPPRRGQIKSLAKKILLVDDNVDAANSLAALLALSEHTTRAVYSGREALQCLDVFSPDIAILDIGLPEMDGYELAVALRALSHMKSLKLIALTGYGQASDREKARVAGFDQYLVKPIDFEALRISLESI